MVVTKNAFLLREYPGQLHANSLAVTTIASLVAGHVPKPCSSKIPSDRPQSSTCASAVRRWRVRQRLTGFRAGCDRWPRWRIPVARLYGLIIVAFRSDRTSIRASQKKPKEENNAQSLRCPFRCWNRPTRRCDAAGARSSFHRYVRQGPGGEADGNGEAIHLR